MKKMDKKLGMKMMVTELVSELATIHCIDVIFNEKVVKDVVNIQFPSILDEQPAQQQPGTDALKPEIDYENNEADDAEQLDEDSRPKDELHIKTNADCSIEHYESWLVMNGCAHKGVTWSFMGKHGFIQTTTGYSM